MSLIGATPIDWAFKTECCGAGLSVSHYRPCKTSLRKYSEDADDRGVEAVIVKLVRCVNSNLDMRRPAINHYLAKTVTIPVLYILQAIRLAVGLTPRNWDWDHL